MSIVRARVVADGGRANLAQRRSSSALDGARGGRLGLDGLEDAEDIVRYRILFGQGWDKSWGIEDDGNVSLMREIQWCRSN